MVTKTSFSPETPPAPFDRAAVRAHRDRAAADFGDTDYLFGEIGDRLTDRLDGFRRDFATILDLGCHNGGLARALAARKGTRHVVACDLSESMIRQTRRLAPAGGAGGSIAPLVADEEALPFRDGCFDAIVSNLSLHWVNDLPGALVQARRMLKPDGLFLAAMLGGETLSALRSAWLEAELEIEGGAGPRVSPFADVRDAGNLLGRAGFALPVADLDTIQVSFENPLRLMADLRAMGETNAIAERRKGPTRRATLATACARYPRDENGRILARFDVVWLTAWAPGPGQQKPLRPGSAAARLADELGSEEMSAREQPAPAKGTGS